MISKFATWVTIGLCLGGISIQKLREALEAAKKGDFDRVAFFDQDAYEFIEFMSKYNKDYATTEEFNKRLENFKVTLGRVRDSEENHEVAINEFADLSDEEWA